MDVCKPTKAKTPPAIVGGTSCAKCGTVGKKKRPSCCGKGGSWFRDCGSAGNKKVGHTWFEGIAVCKPQKKAMAKSAVDEKSAESSEGAAGAIITTAKKLVLKSEKTPKPITTQARPMANPSPKIDVAAPARESAETPIAESGCDHMFKMCFHINFLLFIAIALFF